MKNIIAFLFLALTLTVSAQHTVPRFGTSANECYNGGCLQYKFQSVTTTTATSVSYQRPSAYYTLIKVGTLTHALTDSLSTASAYDGDIVDFIFYADTLTAGRVVTFGNNIKSAGTLTVPNSKSSHSGRATARFIYDAKGVYWTELSRTINTN